MILGYLNDNSKYSFFNNNNNHSKIYQNRHETSVFEVIYS